MCTLNIVKGMMLNMKKTTLYIAIVLLLTIITVGGTYAFLSTTIGYNIINPNASKIDIVYSKGDPIDGNLNLVNNKEEGFNTTVSIGLANGSLAVKADLYIDIEKISEELATDALNWEVYKVQNEVETRASLGTFAKCKNEDGTERKCQTGDKLYIINNYPLSEELTNFKVYIWLDGNKAGNEVIGAELTAHIGAESEKITSDF